MNNSLIIKNKISKFNKTITVSGDKSLSIRWVLLSSLASGVSKADNLLISEDVTAALDAVKIVNVETEIAHIIFAVTFIVFLLSKYNKAKVKGQRIHNHVAK